MRHFAEEEEKKITEITQYSIVYFSWKIHIRNKVGVKSSEMR